MKKHLIITFLLLQIITFSQTKDSVYTFIKETGIQHPEIVMKQCLYESAHLKSTICRENNNLFGMKVPRKRNTLAIGENRGHAVYHSWQYSILDYKMWQDQYYKEGDYYLFLEKLGYSTNNKYISTLKRIKI